MRAWREMLTSCARIQGFWVYHHPRLNLSFGIHHFSSSKGCILQMSQPCHIQLRYPERAIRHMLYRSLDLIYDISRRDG